VTAVNQEPTIPLTTEFLEWIGRERSWGRQAIHAIARQRPLVLTESSGLDRFSVRMALVELTGSVARWGNGLYEGLAKVGRDDAAAQFGTGPPFPATDPGSLDFDRLSEYVEIRVKALGELLAREAPEHTLSAG
jgi:hypothetical protein